MTGRTFLPDQRRRLALAAGVLVALAGGSVLVLRASHRTPDPQQQAAAPPVLTPTPTPSPTARPSGRSPGTPGASFTPEQVAPVLQAHADANAAFLHAISIPDPNDPLLVASMTGVPLANTQQSLSFDRTRNIVGRGDIRLLRPHVVSMTQTTAIVKDCEYSTLVEYHKDTGEVVAGSDTQIPQYIGTTSTFLLLDGRWKLFLKDIHDGQGPDDPGGCDGY